MHAKKGFLALMAALVLLVGAGVAYANGSSGSGDPDEANLSYKGSIAAPRPNGPSLQDLAKIDRAAAEKAALDAVPGTVNETDLESENGYVVYGVDVAGDDGDTHDVKVDAGNGKILHQRVDGADGAGDTEDPN